MKRLINNFAAPIMAIAAVLGMGAISQAQIVETFNSGTALPTNTFFTHDGSGFLGPPNANLAAEGFPLVTAFAGAGGGSAGSATATLGLTATGGVNGSPAALLNVTNDGTVGFAFAGVQQEVGVVANPTSFIATADVLAPAGVPFALRLESPFSGSNNGFELNFVGTGAFQTIGGSIGTAFTAIPGGSFDTTAVSNLVVATQIGGNIAVGDNDIIIDNFSFTQAVPEPGSLVLLAALLPAFAVRRRRS